MDVKIWLKVGRELPLRRDIYVSRAENPGLNLSAGGILVYVNVSDFIMHEVFFSGRFLGLTMRDRRIEVVAEFPKRKN
jgi:hypothetical protein